MIFGHMLMLRLHEAIKIVADVGAWNDPKV